MFSNYLLSINYLLIRGFESDDATHLVVDDKPHGFCRLNIQVHKITE